MPSGLVNKTRPCGVSFPSKEIYKLVFERIQHFKTFLMPSVHLFGCLQAKIHTQYSSTGTYWEFIRCCWAFCAARNPPLVFLIWWAADYTPPQATFNGFQTEHLVQAMRLYASAPHQCTVHSLKNVWNIPPQNGWKWDHQVFMVWHHSLVLEPQMSFTFFFFLPLSLSLDLHYSTLRTCIRECNYSSLIW